MLDQICDVIILAAAVIGAITTILKVLGKPITLFKKKQNEDLSRALAEHDERFQEVIDQKINSLIDEKITPSLQEIKELNQEQSSTIELLINSSKDMLRNDIMSIYERGKRTKSLSQTDREVLDELYKDYKAEHGNGAVERCYNRTLNWEVVDDE